MTDGFVQQNAGPSRTEHDFHLSGGGGDGVEIHERLTHGLFGEVFGRAILQKIFEGDASTAAVHAMGGFVAVFGDNHHIEAAQRLGGGGDYSVAADDEDAAELFGEAGAHLNDARVAGPGGAVGSR